MCTSCRKIGLKNYQRGGNLKKGKVNFENEGGSDPLGHECLCWYANRKEIFLFKLGEMFVYFANLASHTILLETVILTNAANLH